MVIFRTGRIMILHNNDQSLTDKTIKGFFWTFFATSLQIFAKILILFILARILDPEDFGIVNAAMIVIVIAEIFSDFGVSLIILQKRDLSTNHLHTGFTLSILIGTTLTILVFLLAGQTERIFEFDGLTRVIQILSCIFIINGSRIVAESYLKKHMQFKKLAYIQIISYIIGYGLVGIILAFNGFGIWSLVTATIVQAFINSIMCYFLNPHSLKLLFDKNTIKDFIKTGFSVILSKTSAHIALSGDNFIAGRMLGSYALGIYGKTYQLMALPATFISDTVETVVFSAAVNLQHTREKMIKLYTKGLALTALLLLPMSLYISIYSKDIVVLLLGVKWSDVSAPLSVMAFAMFFKTACRVNGLIIRAFGQIRRSVYRHALFAAAVILFSYLGSFYGIFGIATGVVLANIIHFILMTLLCMNILEIRIKNIFSNVYIPAIKICLLVLITFLMQRLLHIYVLVDLSMFVLSIPLTLLTLFVFVIITRKKILGIEGIWLLEYFSGMIKGGH